MLNGVAPHAGAWIETIIISAEKVLVKSHPMRVRGLKLPTAASSVRTLKSHPMRVRGLKQNTNETKLGWTASHPMRVRGLKQMYYIGTGMLMRRTPCGCVG